MRTPLSRLTTSRIDAETQWHTNLKSFALDVYITTGRPIEVATTKQLRDLTDGLVTRWQNSSDTRQGSTPSLDGRLISLVNAHVSQHHGSLEGAVLACLHAVSPTAATQLLSQLQILPHLEYVRCLLNATYMNPGLLNPPESQSAHILHQLLSTRLASLETKPLLDHIAQLKYLLDHVEQLTSSMLLFLLLVDSMLTTSGFKVASQNALSLLLSERSFKVAFDLISWLSSGAKSSATQPNALTWILERHVAFWTSLSRWQPNYQRVRLWEARGLDDIQRKKLVNIFDLEGPDLAGKHQTYRHSEPTCYSRAPFLPRVQESLDRMLKILDKAIGCGKVAVDLFIHFFVDQEPSEKAFSLAEAAVDAGEDCCQAFLFLQSSFDTDCGMDLADQLEKFAHSLPKLQFLATLDVRLAQRLADTSQSLLIEGQPYFCAQLDRGDGETFGVILFDFLSGLAESSWIHPLMDVETVGSLDGASLPSRSTVEAIFQQLKAFDSPFSNPRNKLSGNPGGGCGRRLKEYLKKTLGGQGGMGTEDTEQYMQLEARFWASRPSTDHIELAQVIACLPTVSDDLYTRCLAQMVKEEDLVVHDLLPRIRERIVHSLARHLAQTAKGFGLRGVHSCWISLLECLIAGQGDTVTTRAMENLSATHFLQFIDDIGLLTNVGRGKTARPVNTMLGASEGMLAWWSKLSHVYRNIVQLISETFPPGAKYTWLLIDPTAEVRGMLDICRDPDSLPEIQRSLFTYLQPDGSNVHQLFDTLKHLGDDNKSGTTLCRRILERREQRTTGWSRSMLSTLIMALDSDPDLDGSIKSLLLNFSCLVGLRPKFEQVAVEQLLSTLAQSYETIIDQGSSLERQRARMRRTNPQRTAEILTPIGIEDVSRRGTADAFNLIPDSLVDVADVDTHGNYRLCFPLTTLSELQMKARGVPAGWRAVILCVSFASPSQFCLHAGHEDDTDDGHSATHDGLVRGARGSHLRQACTKGTSLFAFRLCNHVDHLLASGGAALETALESFYKTVAQFIRDAPAECTVCAEPLGIKLWKPTTCGSPACSISQQDAALEVRLHQLLADPLALDVLLTSAYAAAGDHAKVDFFPGCPVAKDKIRPALDALPSLSELTAAPDLTAALGALDPNCEAFLSWLCLTFRGYLATAPADRLHIPGFPHTPRFVLLNSPPERERAFAAYTTPRPSHHHYQTPAAAGPVFHGTRASRLLPILSQGLHVMSGSTGQIHGASSGRGVYCGDEPATSWPYAERLAARNWRRSALAGGLHVLLACELAGYAPGQAVHVVAPAERLLVRFVFLVPSGTQLPARRHVDVALSAAFAQLRSGM